MTDNDPITREFHAHLDVCKRCRDQPFNMCPTGNQLLQEAVDKIPGALTPAKDLSQPREVK